MHCKSVTGVIVIGSDSAIDEGEVSELEVEEDGNSVNVPLQRRVGLVVVCRLVIFP